MNSVFLFLTIVSIFHYRLQAQTHYFTYKIAHLDTHTFQLSNKMSGLKFPASGSGYSCYIRQNDLLYHVNKDFSKEFENVPNSRLYFSPNVEIINYNKFMIKPIFQIVNFSKMMSFNFEDSSYLKINTIPPLKSTKQKDGKIKYIYNEEVYFVVDPKGDHGINPGILADYIKGSIVEIKTRFNHFELISHKLINDSKDLEKLRNETSFVNFNTLPEKSVYPFIRKDKPLEPFTIAKLTPGPKNK